MEKPSGVNKVGENSVQQGIDFLGANNEEIVIKLSHGAWNLAHMQSDSAKTFQKALDENGRHSGASFGVALEEVIHRAEKELGYKITIEDVEGGDDKIVRLSKVKN